MRHLKVKRAKVWLVMHKKIGAMMSQVYPQQQKSQSPAADHKKFCNEFMMQNECL